jgi:hypothetical protein
MRELHGKKIASVWWPDTDTEQGRHLRANDGRDLNLSVTHHGDHDEVWIVESKGGREVARHNPRYVESIVWEDGAS